MLRPKILIWENLYQYDQLMFKNVLTMTLGCHGNMKVLLGEAKKMNVDLDWGEMVCLAGALFVHGLYPG